MRLSCDLGSESCGFVTNSCGIDRNRAKSREAMKTRHLAPPRHGAADLPGNLRSAHRLHAKQGVGRRSGKLLRLAFGIGWRETTRSHITCRPWRRIIGSAFFCRTGRCIVLFSLVRTVIGRWARAPSCTAARKPIRARARTQSAATIAMHGRSFGYSCRMRRSGNLRLTFAQIYRHRRW